MEDLRHKAGDARIQKSERDSRLPLEEVNNFRAQINQERSEYLRREIEDRERTALADRARSLEIVRGEQSGKTAACASIVGVVVILVRILLHFLKIR